MLSDDTRCVDCGAALQIGGESRCDACRKKREKLLGQLGGTVSRGSSRSSVKNISDTIEASHYMRQADDSDEMCGQCRARHAQKGSPYCLACRLALHKSLGDAATNTADREKYRPKKPEDRMKTMSPTEALREKRRRTGTHRFNPAPSLRKGYR